jgi:hypothetical protein
MDMEEEFQKLVSHFNLLNSSGTAGSVTESNDESCGMKDKCINTLRTRLHSKKIRKCTDCNQILVKPEPKASSTKFLIRYSAMDYYPVITISPDLKVFNPSSSIMGISFLDTQLKSVKVDPGNSCILSTDLQALQEFAVSCTTDDSILNFRIKLQETCQNYYERI